MLLFAYGTLQPERAPVEIRPWVSKFALVGEGTVRGRVYQFEEYPGLKLGRTGGEVRGKLFEIPDDPKLLQALDAYEECDTLFRRKPVTVTLGDGSKRTAQVYEYAKRVPRMAIKPKVRTAGVKKRAVAGR
ncbi:MAG: hypothetical protein NVS9B15_20520 [Acidobacteriaceae bacterium]